MQTATAQADSGATPEDPAETGLWDRFRRAANRPVSAQSTVVFRIGFGLLVAFGSIRFLARGWVDKLYLEPESHLTYVGFEWVRPLPAPFMQVVVAGLAICGIAIALGYRHRLAAGLFTVGFAYCELIDSALYLNHYWYVTLAGLLVTLLPVQHHWSLDVRSGRVRGSTTVPAAVVWALRAQLAVVYVFAGIAKLNADWLLDAQPLSIWLAHRTHVPLVGPLLDEPLVAHVASWAGAVFDCAVVPLLLWRRTRRFAYASVVVFHLATAALFQIGVFPWVMIVGTLVFFEPDWPRRVLVRLGVSPASPARTTTRHRLRIPSVLLVGLLCLALVQIVLPLRHLLYPGDVRWTEEGYYMSWRVMLTEKTGTLDFEVTDPDTGRSFIVEPESVLEDWQAEQAATRPDLLLAAAHLVAERQDEHGRPQVRARSFVSINGRPAARLVDPSVDLAAVPRTHGHASWINRMPD